MEDGGRRAAAMSTISDQLAVPDSPGLRDLLKAHNSIRRRRRRRLADKRYSSSTAAAAAEASSLRTLHEILRDGEEGSGGSRERLRRRRRPDAAESTIPVAPLPPDHHHDHSMEPFVTLEVILAEHRPEMSMEEEEEQPPVRVSLMALLEQTTEGGIHAAAMEEEEGDGRLSRCCVCMTRAKGAAFIPCGHTFCRPCARELMKRRRCCPLCNADIHQILKIY